MALPTINLDDRTYAQLLGILRGHIPGEEWSDHNPSDPGIALLELLTWLGEMSLYRMNRIPQTHRDKFLKLLADPPVPVTVELALKLTPARATDVAIPPGLRFATDYKNGKRYVFESYLPAVLSKPPPGGDQTGVLQLRAIREVVAEPLGVGDGTPDQVFTIAESPVLVDLAGVVSGYDPNPRVRVGVDEWELRPFLLSQSSHTPAPPALKHFMVDEFENQVRFGDDIFGAVVPAGAAVELIRYQALEGPAALVAAGEIKHVLDPGVVPGLLPGDLLSIAGHADAQGGENFFSRDERMRRGLATFRESTRLVTAADFERVATVDFNAFQESFNLAQGLPLDTGLIGRAVALMNRWGDVPNAGHVTLLVLPRLGAAFDAAPLPTKIGMAVVPAAVSDRLAAFLEPRRLITTRLHLDKVDLKAVSAQVVAVIDRERNTLDMGKAIEAALRAHLGVETGYDGGGWPLGRAVRRSQLYELLEGLAGVDHVESITLTPASATGDVELLPRELPVWDSLSVLVKRA